MGLDKLAPRPLAAVTRWAKTGGPEPCAHRGRGYGDAKPFQFPDNPRIPPARVLTGEPQHQLPRLPPYRRSTDWARVRPPLRDQASMPAQQRRRRDDEGSP